MKENTNGVCAEETERIRKVEEHVVERPSHDRVTTGSCPQSHLHDIGRGSDALYALLRFLGRLDGRYRVWGVSVLWWVSYEALATITNKQQSKQEGERKTLHHHYDHHTRINVKDTTTITGFLSRAWPSFCSKLGIWTLMRS